MIHTNISKDNKYRPLYRQLHIIYNKLSILDANVLYDNSAFQFKLLGGKVANISKVVYKSNYGIMLKLVHEDGYLLFDLFISRTGNLFAIEVSNRKTIDPEMVAIYLEQLEMQINCAFYKYQKIDHEQYFNRLITCLQ